jgi:hypothetical protein
MIRTLSKFLVPGVAALALAPAISADGRNPGSVLIFPIHRSNTSATDGYTYFTALSVTNTNLTPATPINGLGGSTWIHWEYVNVIPGQVNNLPLDCQVVDRIELLTPADTRTVLTNCHNASGGQEGYVVVTALDPNSFITPWSHNYLIGSELVVSGTGGFYNLDAIPFEAIAESGGATDADGDGQRDFDGVEYEGIADDLYLDVFFGLDASSLTLINMTGGFQHTANVRFDVWNDNEQPLSATLAFKCWIEEPLSDISLVFDGTFLANNTADDPSEFDSNCDGTGDIETGWARLRGSNASSSVESIPNPALLGALTAGPADGVSIDGGHLLWESTTKQFNGDFFKTGTDDPEN